MKTTNQVNSELDLEETHWRVCLFHFMKLGILKKYLEAFTSISNKNRKLNFAVFILTIILWPFTVPFKHFLYDVIFIIFLSRASDFVCIFF